MILSKLYCNDEKRFKTLTFEDGINFVLSEDHSVGKSTLFKLIDYCLFKSPPDFLRLEMFANLEFYLEIKIKDNLFVTVKRCTFGRANDCIKVAKESGSYIGIEDTQYDFKGGEEKALEYFQDAVGFMLPNMRSYVSFFLRDQDNQSDVFRLNKFIRSKDIDYKPIVANLLGIDGEVIRKKYLLEEDISDDATDIKRCEQDLGVYKTKESILEELNVYQEQLNLKEKTYEEFDFYLSEHNISQELVDDVEQNISKLNSKANSLKREIDYIDNAQKTNMSVSMDDIDGLFKEMKVLFPDSLRNNYASVIEFNQQITKERTAIFKENKKKFEASLQGIDGELQTLNAKRKEMLGILRETNTMAKFKMLEKEMIEIKSSIKLHESKLEIFKKIDSLKEAIERDRNSLDAIIKQKESLAKTDFVDELKKSVKMFGKIVFDRDLAFSVGYNTNNNLEFDLKIASSSSKGFDNFEDDGYTVKKLLCFVFSASLAYTHNNEHFFKFVAFDSPFDGDKNVWQNGVYKALKKLAEGGIQTLITTITDEIKNAENLQEVKDEYARRTLSEKDKLLGDF